MGDPVVFGSPRWSSEATALAVRACQVIQRHLTTRFLTFPWTTRSPGRAFSRAACSNYTGGDPATTRRSLATTRRARGVGRGCAVFAPRYNGGMGPAQGTWELLPRDTRALGVAPRHILHAALRFLAAQAQLALHAGLTVGCSRPPGTRRKPRILVRRPRSPCLHAERRRVVKRDGRARGNLRLCRCRCRCHVAAAVTKAAAAAETHPSIWPRSLRLARLAWSVGLRSTHRRRGLCALRQSRLAWSVSLLALRRRALGIPRRRHQILMLHQRRRY